MFIVDDVIREYLTYVRERLLQDRKANQEAIIRTWRAMRGISATLAEFGAQLALQIALIEEVRQNPELFSARLRDFSRSHDVYQLAEASGICLDLRMARDELTTIGIATDAPVAQLAWFLEEHRCGIVSQIGRLLFRARWAYEEEGKNPEEVLKMLRDSRDALATTIREIDAVLNDIRDSKFERTSALPLALGERRRLDPFPKHD